MRFWTIWTIPAMSFKNRLLRTREWAASEIASHLPKRIKYWATLQSIGYATRTSNNIPATPLDEVLENLPRPKFVA